MKEYFIKLLEELPVRTVIWKTADGNITSTGMIAELYINSEISKQYVTEVLRVSRDMIMRQSTNHK